MYCNISKTVFLALFYKLKKKKNRFEKSTGIQVVDQFLNQGSLATISVTFLIGHAENGRESNPSACSISLYFSVGHVCYWVCYFLG